MAEREARLGGVAEVANAIRMAAAEDEKSLGRAVFFIGAGCSVSAGIPLASGMARSLVQRLARKAPQEIRADPDAAYRWLASKQQMRDCFMGPAAEGEDKRAIDWNRVYDAVFSDHFNTPDDAREVFSGFVDAANGQVNWAHLCLGELVKQKLVSTVITTNFDQLVLAGLVRSGVLPVVCDGVESLSRIRGAPRHPQIIELHGSRHIYRLRNSPQEVAELANDEPTIAAIGSIFQDLRAFVLVGYGGREGGIMDLLIKAGQRFPDKRLIWVAHNKDPGQLTDKAKRFLATSRNSILLVGEDADSFFLRLLMALEIGAPETIREPLFLISRHADLLATHKDSDVADSTAITDAIGRHRAEITAMLTSLATHRSNRTRIEKALTEARNLRLAGKLSDAFHLLDSMKDTNEVEIWKELADVAYEFGETAPERKPLEVAVEAHHRLLARLDRKAHPIAWSWAQNALGDALSELGERESGIVRLEQAVAAYRDALQERTRERAPLDWAMTQNNLGNALAALGERETGTGRLEEAVAAYREALQEQTRERVPLNWAMTMNNLGTALGLLDEREGGTARLKEAVATFGEALQERTRERVPLEWAATRNNLGNVLLALGERESGTTRLEQAVAAFHAALQEYTRERAPLNWAGTQNNLGIALRTLGERESDTARLEQAVAAFRQALQEYKRDRVPLDWAMTQNNLGTALRTLGQHESGASRLEEAVAAYEAALAMYEEAGASYYVQGTRENLSHARALLDRLRGREKSAARRKKA